MSEPFTLTRAQVRELDRRAMDEYGIPGIVLMENAGRGCAELLMRLNPEKKPTVILCGPGNNGGDGFVMARHLDNHGWPVMVWDFSGNGGSEELRVNRSVATRTELVKYPLPAGAAADAGDVHFPCWYVDALFGTGLSRPLADPFDKISACNNFCDQPTLAIDIPSGLDCDTGEPLGPTVRATHTATFVAPKRGFLNPASKQWTGEVHVIDIGAPRKLIDEYRR
jgi:NAD(P)H-hydrate epimerase